MDKNKPARVLRDGNLKATIWANQGENGIYFTVSLAKTFTDSQGTVRDTSSFSSPELLRVSELARQAYHASNDLRAEYKRNFNPMAAGPIYQPGNGQAPQEQLPYQQGGEGAAPQNAGYPQQQYAQGKPSP